MIGLMAGKDGRIMTVVKKIGGVGDEVNIDLPSLYLTKESCGRSVADASTGRLISERRDGESFRGT
jgi:hypothetical protein